jgi:competence protein ComGC
LSRAEWAAFLVKGQMNVFDLDQNDMVDNLAQIQGGRSNASKHEAQAQ